MSEQRVRHFELTVEPSDRLEHQQAVRRIGSGPATEFLTAREGLGGLSGWLAEKSANRVARRRINDGYEKVVEAKYQALTHQLALDLSEFKRRASAEKMRVMGDLYQDMNEKKANLAEALLFTHALESGKSAAQRKKTFVQSLESDLAAGVIDQASFDTLRAAAEEAEACARSVVNSDAVKGIEDYDQLIELARDAIKKSQAL